MKANKSMIACAAVMVAAGIADDVRGMDNEQQGIKFVRFSRVRGGRYTGEVNSLKIPHGYGVKAYFRGFFHVGTFVNGTPNGYGASFFSNGDIYVGGFADGIPHGKGAVLFCQRKALYRGDFVHGEWHGKGKLINPEGTYEGDFVKGEKHGIGKLTLPNGLTYEGTFTKGVSEDYLMGFASLFGIFDSNPSEAKK